MAWTQFLYGEDVIVKVSRDTAIDSADDVVIRPTTLKYRILLASGSAFITVPYSSTGVRFSVEFQDDLWTYRNAAGGQNSHYVQDVTSKGPGYVSSYTNSMPIVGVEPLNSLLIFASPFPSQDLIPYNQAVTLYVKPGLVTGLSQTSKSIVYFGPGVYYLTGTSHALLSSSVNWVYFAPGAYVKGAVQYTSKSLNLKATGFGVLSGEQYVYQANPANNYENVPSDSSTLHMWRADTTSKGVSWTLHGVTINAPPFNSMDFYGAVATFTVDASDYKQVGAFFGQTDGIEMYSNSHVRDIFYHSSDDTIKTYYSNILAERITVWKTNNAPILQFGWYQRNLTNITVDSVDVIHSRYISQSANYPRALVGSSGSYLNPASTSNANIYSHISSFTVSNWRSEGISPALLGINPLENIDNFNITNVWIEELAPLTTLVDMSSLRPFTDATNGGNKIKIGANSPGNVGLTITNFQVGGTRISFAANNWNLNSLGRLNINGAFSGRWIVS